MGVFYQEDPPNPSRKCFLAGVLKDAFCNCHTFRKPLPKFNDEDEYPTSDFDDTEEVLTNLSSPHISTDIVSFCFYFLLYENRF